MRQISDADIGNMVTLIEQIGRHNQHNSPDAKFFRPVLKLMTGQCEGPPSAIPSLMPENDDLSYEEKAERLFRQYSGLLAATGLELAHNLHREIPTELARRRGNMLPSPNSAADADRLDVIVIDATRLTNFLRSISPKAVERSGVQGMLEKLAEMVDVDLLHKYSTKILGAEVEDFDQHVRLLDKVASEFSRLGISTQANDLLANLEHFHQGDLFEYRRVVESRLLDISQFGPHMWHLDSSADRYRELWEGAVLLAEDISHSEDARPLASQLARHLRKCVQGAEVEIEAQLVETAPDSYARQQGLGKLSILPDMRERLDRLLKLAD